MNAPTFARIERALLSTPTYEVLGQVREVVGLIVESSGPPAKIGDLCFIETLSGQIASEVVGFRGDRVLLMPLGELAGIRAGCTVRAAGHVLRMPSGPGLLGRAVNGLGHPIDGLGPLDGAGTYPVTAPPPNALERQMIAQPFITGVRSIDGCLTMGIGPLADLTILAGHDFRAIDGLLTNFHLPKSSLLVLVSSFGGHEHL